MPRVPVALFRGGEQPAPAPPFWQGHPSRHPAKVCRRSCRNGHATSPNSLLLRSAPCLWPGHSKRQRHSLRAPSRKPNRGLGRRHRRRVVLRSDLHLFSAQERKVSETRESADAGSRPGTTAGPPQSPVPQFPGVWGKQKNNRNSSYLRRRALLSVGWGGGQ